MTLYGAETTVLGIGNVILSDEGFGVRVVEFLAANYDFSEDVQLVDGGTLGIELTQFVTDSKRLLVIDSINGGKEPGTRFRFVNDEVQAHFQDKLSAHEVGIQDVLTLLTLTGKKIPEVVVIGAQPFFVEPGVTLSEGMKDLMPKVAEEEVEQLTAWGIAAQKKAVPIAMDYTTVAEASKNY